VKRQTRAEAIKVAGGGAVWGKLQAYPSLPKGGYPAWVCASRTI
jgi:hypothetical protein